MAINNDIFTQTIERGLKADKDFAISNADILVEDQRDFFETKASRILKISKKRLKILR